MKNFFASKINISGLVVMLIGLQDFIGNYSFKDMSVKSWVTFGIGMAIVVFRTYFTSGQISAPFKTMPVVDKSAQ